MPFIFSKDNNTFPAIADVHVHGMFLAFGSFTKFSIHVRYREINLFRKLYIFC